MSPRTWSVTASASLPPPARTAGTARPPTGRPDSGRGRERARIRHRQVPAGLHPEGPPHHRGDQGQARGGGRRAPAVHAAVGRARRRARAEERDGQRREQPEPVGGRAVRRRCGRQRGPDDQAMAPAGPGSGLSDPQAHDAHHGRRGRPGGLGMGHKVHPYGYRLGYTRTWTAKWYADKEYTTLLKEDIAIRQLLDRRLANASVSGVEIERGINHVTVAIHTAKPGIVIGRGGQNVEILRKEIGDLTKRKVKLEIKEIRQPELDAYLVALNIAQQLTRRVAYKKAMKQSIQRSMKAGAKGVKIALAGRLGGSEMGRREWDREGRIPLGTLRADISYGQVHAHTTYGRIGVKVWIYKGEIPVERKRREAAAVPAAAAAAAAQGV